MKRKKKAVETAKNPVEDTGKLSSRCRRLRRIAQQPVYPSRLSPSQPAGVWITYLAAA